MADTLGTSWLNANSLRNYPLSQMATGVATDSSFSIPDNLLLDMKLAIPFIANSAESISAINPSKFYISSIKVYPQGFIFFVGCDLNPQIAVSEPVSFSNAQEYDTVAVRGIFKPISASGQYFDFSQVYGFAVIGDVSSLKTVTGDIPFDINGARLESSVISYGPRRISGIKVFSDSSTSSLLTGQVILASSTNHRMTLTSTADAHTITMSAINDDDMQEDCGCNDIQLGDCIRTINGVAPDSSGNIDILGGDCIEITPGGSSLTIKDTCAQPCCGCEELNALVTDVTGLTSQLTLLQSKIELLNGAISTLQDTCLASRVDAASCTSDNEPDLLLPGGSEEESSGDSGTGNTSE
jgi:hypothetical protein